MASALVYSTDSTSVESGETNGIRYGRSYPEIDKARIALTRALPKICSDLEREPHFRAAQAAGLIWQVRYEVLNHHASELASDRGKSGKCRIEILVGSVRSLRKSTPEDFHDLIDRAIELFTAFERAVLRASTA